MVAKFQCPDCAKVYRSNAGLGGHRRRAHGVIGTSSSAVKVRELNQAKAARAVAAEARKEKSAPAVARALEPQQPPRQRRKYTKRSQLATLPATESTVNHHTQNGHSPSQFETAVAVAYGRFTQLCLEVASQFDVPPASFTRQLASFISRAHP